MPLVTTLRSHNTESSPSISRQMPERVYWQEAVLLLHGIKAHSKSHIYVH